MANAQTPDSEWARLPGKSRQYVNTETGEILSRRQYDQRIGRLAQAGIKSNEAQAELNRTQNIEAHLSRPARGRKSISEYSPETQQEIIEGRKALASQKAETSAMQKKIRAMKAKANRSPKKITDRHLVSGRLGKRIDVPLSYEAIHYVIRSARGSHVTKWGVGVNGINIQTGEPVTFWFRQNRFSGMTSIEDDFTREDFEQLMAQCMEKTYFMPISAFVHFTFDSEYAANKKEKAVRAKRKQVFGNSV